MVSPAVNPGPLAFRRGTTGAVRVGFGAFDERAVVSIAIEPGDGERQPVLTATDGESLAAAATMALEKRIPLVASIASSGSDIEEGVAAMHGWGHAARAIVNCSGVVPLIFAIDGPAVAGPAMLLGLADLVVMTAESYAFVSGPHMVRQFTGEVLTNADLGGAGLHARSTGVASVVVPDAVAVNSMIGALLSYFPSHADELPPVWPNDDPPTRTTPALRTMIPESSTGSYDVRNVIELVTDAGSFLELRAGWATNLVTGLAMMGGRPVGVVGNQPQSLAGTLDIAASQKGGRFVAMCDAFNLPLVTFVDTSGFYPGKDLEWRGMIRYGAQMAFAYARARVPRVCVTLRKSYGGAYIVMDSKYMGNDLSLAWPSAEIAVMGAKGAVEILHRRATPEERAEQERVYEERLLNPYIAAERGSVDRIIAPADTRREIAAALDILATKRESLPRRRHDNTPL
jgi:acetyl-CoA carboxylase carboxyltransferase component